MRPTFAAVTALLGLAGPARAHEIDEYVQGATIAVEKGRVRVELRLVPGAAVFSHVRTAIDTDGDGAFSAAERGAYARRVLRDLSLAVDGEALDLRIGRTSFAPMAELRDGLGVIQLTLDADVPAGGPERRLVFDNGHMRGIGVYLVNGLASRDPRVRPGAQRRNWTQSHYELAYVETADERVSAAHGGREVRLASARSSRWLLAVAWIGAAAIPQLAWFARRRRRTAAAKPVRVPAR